MNYLMVCERDPKCVWSRIARAKDDPKDIAARDKHYARHDAMEARKAARALTKATPEGDAHKNKDVRGVGDRGSRSPSPISCACCDLGLFGVHGVGHTGPHPASQDDLAEVDEPSRGYHVLARAM